MQEHHEHLILKLLDGTIAAAEKEELDRWMEESAGNREIVERSRLLWKTSQLPSTAVNFQTEQEWKKLASSIQELPAERAVERALFSKGYALKVAASIAFLILCSFILYLTVFKQHTIVNESNGTITYLTLPDGSEVWLNKESKITYADDFRGSERSVELSGEAFFQVTKNADKPFIIHTPEAEVRVLGTSFNVKAYDGDTTTSVFVVTGLVQFSDRHSQQNGLALKPGEAAALDHDRSLVVREGENENVLAWKERKLTFRKTHLRDVAKALERYFNITVEVGNKELSSCRFTSSFNDPSLEEVMEALRISLDLKIVRQPGNIYTLEGDGC
jgi:transmembrane sensor